MIREPHSRELVGYERTRAVDDHLTWLAGRWPSEALRAADHDPREGDSPIATWCRGHRLAQAEHRSRTRNRKRFDRRDDARRLVDEVN